MRTSGILMPIFSLNSKYGIGTFGREAYKFVDFLESAGQTYWQILPLSPTSYGDSPYQSFSAYAGNPYFIDLEILEQKGYLNKSEYCDIDWGSGEEVNYSALYLNRFNVLKKAYYRFIDNPTEDYYLFLEKNMFWLNDYSLFMAIKTEYDGKSWIEWPNELKFRHKEALLKAQKDFKNEIEFFKVLEYFFYVQWNDLKSYANSKKIKIIGDIPIYVAYDSADVWCEPEQFHLDEKLIPIEVAGCPPDAFTAKGQLWGNPLYNWDYMKNTPHPYDWWQRRIEYTLKLYDVIRIDHFRGFESYYAVPYGYDDAVNGTWRKGPGIDFFDSLKEKFGNLPIIAEDLGFFTDDVYEMLSKTGFPGMKVLEFGFDEAGNSAHLPHNCPQNSVVYTGTHDNNTIMGWKELLDQSKLRFMMDYLNIKNETEINWAMINSAFATISDTVIIPIQDYLGIDGSGRINTPSTLGQNWKWRVRNGQINDQLANKMRSLTEIYSRLNNETSN